MTDNTVEQKRINILAIAKKYTSSQDNISSFLCYIQLLDVLHLQPII
jgi:hypothetical protein